MADKKATITMLPSKRKSVSEMGSPSPSPKSMKSESDSGTNQPEDEIAAAAKPDIQIFPGFMPNDLTLVVEGINIHVNEDLLSSASPVFESWLKKEWQQDNTKKELKFPGKTYAEMAIFLKCLLHIFPDKVTTGTLATVLPLADEYQTNNLIKECVEVIRNHVESVSKSDIYIPPPEVVKYLRWIEQYNLNSIENCVVKLASFLDTKALQGVPDYQIVSKRLQLEVYKARAKLLESVMVFNVQEIERKMTELQLPLSEHYMVEWKNIVKEIVLVFLAYATAPKVKGDYERTSERINLNDVEFKTSYKPTLAAKKACLYICDKFNISVHGGRGRLDQVRKQCYLLY